MPSQLMVISASMLHWFGLGYSRASRNFQGRIGPVRPGQGSRDELGYAIGKGQSGGAEAVIKL